MRYRHLQHYQPRAGPAIAMAPRFGQEWNKDKHNLALRSLFEVTDKYDIKSMNEFFEEAIVKNSSEFELADLIEIGDKYENVNILDAGFQKLVKETARHLINNETHMWTNYSVTTKDRLISALGRLLC